MIDLAAKVGGNPSCFVFFGSPSVSFDRRGRAGADSRGGGRGGQGEGEPLIAPLLEERCATAGWGACPGSSPRGRGAALMMHGIDSAAGPRPDAQRRRYFINGRPGP
ncbi:hopanoid C-3 methylase HpnR, partial [Streptomyces thinghirensis]|nr:hopanoid C-3 methylase HpnR [Streptomyces thinghirensis]